MTISSSAGVEDPRFVERAAPKLEDEFPEGSRIFFLGEHAYGVAAQVSGTTDDSLSVVLAVSIEFSIYVIACRIDSYQLVFPLRHNGERPVQIHRQLRDTFVHILLSIQMAPGLHRRFHPEHLKSSVIQDYLELHDYHLRWSEA